MSFLFCVEWSRISRMVLRRTLTSLAELRPTTCGLILILFIFTAACGPRTAVVARASNSNAATAEHAININTATLDELERIPHVGEKVAARIIEQREMNGPFRRVEHLMLIQGISDKRFRKIRPLVRVE